MEYRGAIAPKDWESVILEARVTSLRHGLGEAVVKAMKGEKLAAEGTVKFLLVPRANLKF